MHLPLNETQHHCIGAIRYYNSDRSKREPLFLQRNINAFLESHSRRVKKSVAIREGRPDSNAMADNSRPTRIWNFREIQQLLAQRSFDPSSPVLRVDLLSIKDRKAEFRNSDDVDEPATKSARNYEPIAARLSLTIWPSASPDDDKKIKQTKDCTIERRQRSREERYATVHLKEPFLIGLNDFYENIPTQARPADSQTFNMQFFLTAANEHEKWPPVPVRCKTPDPPFRKDAGVHIHYPLLVGSWPRLPRCPENADEALLEVQHLLPGGPADHRGRLLKSKLSFKVDISWCEPTSPLAIVNREFKATGHAENLDAARLSLQPSEDSLPNIVSSTRWVIDRLQDFIAPVTWDGYACALCKRTFPGSDHLHFHICNSHDLFSYEVYPEIKRNSLGQTLSDVTIRVSKSSAPLKVLAEAFRRV